MALSIISLMSGRCCASMQWTHVMALAVEGHSEVRKKDTE